MQPKSITAALVAASLTVGGLSHGAPIFQSRTESSQPTVTGPQANSESKWKLPSFFKSKEEPSPQLMYQTPESKPSVGARLKGALTNNLVTRAFGGGEPDVPTLPQPEKKYDPLSLEHPVTAPTPELILSMAQVREAQGQVDAARQMYQQAIASHPREARCFRELGHFEDRQGNLAEAEAQYRRALAVAPQDSASINDLALCLARQGKLEESAGHLQQAIQLNPQKSRYRNNLATVLMELGDQQGALQQLLAAHPPAVAHYNMGHLLEKGGHAEPAAGYYAEASRLDPSFAPARDALARLTSTMPVVAANPQAVPHHTPGETTATAPVQASHAPAYQRHSPATTAVRQQPVVPPVVAPLPTTQPPVTWPAQPQTPAASAEPHHEPTFGPKLLPPVR